MKSILKQIINEWRGNLFLFAELLLVFTVLWYIVDLVAVTTRVYTAPMGFSVDHCYNITIGKLTPKAAAYTPNLTSDDDMGHLLELTERLQHRPGIEAVALSQNSYPYNEGSNSISIGIDTTWVNARLYWVGPGFFHLFRYFPADGTPPDRMDEALRRGQLVISSNLTDGYGLEMKDATPLLGREVGLWNQESEQHRRVGAVGKPVRWSHFSTSHEWGGAYIAVALDMDRLKRFADPRYIDVSLRVTPEEDHDFMTRLMNDADRLYQVGNLYLLDITPYTDLRHLSEMEDMNELKTQLCVLGFLLMNIFLGVVGTFWFRTQHRRSEVALRMAMGSARRAIFSRLLTEGLLLLTLAALPATLIAFNVGSAELVDTVQLPFDALRLLSCVGITWLLMALMVTAGIWYPASRAMKVQPAEALHNE